MKRSHFYLKVSILFALAYWFFDSLVHYFIYGEFEFEIIPSEVNELWMRTVIFLVLVAFGLFADHHTTKIQKTEQEKKEVYKSMLFATNHILNNFLNNMMLFHMEAKKCKDFNPEILNQYQKIINDASAQIKKLDGIETPNKNTIEERFRPQ